MPRARRRRANEVQSCAGSSPQCSATLDCSSEMRRMLGAQNVNYAGCEMTSVLDPRVQGGAFDDFLRAAAPSSRAQQRWTPADGPMPAIYLSHGAPPLFNDAHWIDQLFGWSRSLPKPTA